MKLFPSKPDVYSLTPFRGNVQTIASYKHNLAFRQVRAEEKRFNVIERGSQTYYELLTEKYLNKYCRDFARPKEITRVKRYSFERTFDRFDIKSGVQRKINYKLAHAFIKGYKYYKFYFNTKHKIFKLSTKRKPYRFFFNTFNRFWQFRWEKNLRAWFYPFANQYYAKLKRTAAKITIMNKRIYPRRQKDILNSAEPSVLFFLKDLWPLLPITFFLNMLKSNFFFINGQVANNPFKKINRFDIVSFNISPFAFIILLLFFNRIATKTFQRFFSKTKTKKFNVSGAFEVNYNTLEIMLRPGSGLKILGKRDFINLKTDWDAQMQQYMYKKQRKFGFNRK